MRSEERLADLDRAIEAVADLPSPMLSEMELHDRILGLLTVVNRLHAQIVADVGEFDRRKSWQDTGQHTTKTWLQAFARLSGPAARSLVRAAAVVLQLSALADAFSEGAVSLDHVRRVVDLQADVGPSAVAQVADTLVAAARAGDPTELQQVCDHVRHWVKPDGPEPTNTRRSFTLSRTGNGWAARGWLDPEGGALVQTALDAYTTPPVKGDGRDAATRRHDALVEMARDSLGQGRTPTAGGVRPHVGVLFPYQVLNPDQFAFTGQAATTSDAGSDGEPQGTNGASRTESRGPSGDSPSDVAGDRADDPAGEATGHDPRGSAGDRSAGARGDSRHVPPRGSRRQDEPGHGDRIDPTDHPRTGVQDGRPQSADPTASTDPAAPVDPTAPDDPAIPDWAGPMGGMDGPVGRPAFGSWWSQPAWLDWFGPISAETARRILCDSDVYRVVLDPATGLPLDVGRAYRLAPPWLRRLLWARDRGCRFTGCKAPSQWTDAHHVREWKADHGPTAMDNLISLCRPHHVLVHEGGWRINFDPATGELTVFRPDGTPYELGPTRPFAGAVRRPRP